MAKEVDLEDLIRKSVSDAVGDAMKSYAKTTNKTMEFATHPIEGSDLVDAECSECHTHGYVKPVMKNSEKIVEKAVPPEGWINPKESEFKDLAPILEHHQNNTSLFTCPNCADSAIDWFLKQPGIDVKLKERKKRLANL